MNTNTHEKEIDSIFNKLSELGCLDKSHSGRSLKEHLIGTYKYLNKWKCRKDLCIAGLCHSIYGTESFNQISISNNERQKVKEIIGSKSETIVFYFGIHVKDHFWKNIEKKRDFRLQNRITNEEFAITKNQLDDMVTLTLANWLEQRPKYLKTHANLRKQEFLNSETFLPQLALLDFKNDYNIL